MKTLWSAFVVLLLLHLLVAVGFVIWLNASGRLNQERIERAKSIFVSTIEQEQDANEQTVLDAELAKQDADELARLARAADGPVTVSDRLEENRETRELTLRKIERLRSEIGVLQRNLKFTRDQLTKEKDQFEEERKAFEAFRREDMQVANDENFRRAVETYENLNPKQTKAIFQEMLAQGKQGDVVELLQSMQLRKRAAVLDAFKSAREIEQATALIESLRLRGHEMEEASRRFGSDT